MFRAAAVVVTLAFGATTAAADGWSFAPPDGWLRNLPRAEELQLPGVEIRVYRTPGDASVELVTGKFQTSGKSEVAVATRSIDESVTLDTNAGYHVSSRWVKDEQDHAVGESVTVNGAITHHLRLWAAFDPATSRHDVAFAYCLGPTAALATCERSLDTVMTVVHPRAKLDGGYLLTLALEIFSGLVLLVCVGLFIRYLRRKRLLKRSAPLVDNELVTVTGVVCLLGEPLVAPLSGTQCVVHRSRARVFDPHRGVEESVETAGARFAIDTPNGRVVIEDPPELELVPSPVVPRIEERELAFLANHHVAVERHRDAGFDEIVVAPGARIVMRGMVRVERDPASPAERGYRDDAPSIVRLVASDRTQVTIRQMW